MGDRVLADGCGMANGVVICRFLHACPVIPGNVRLTAFKHQYFYIFLH
jgi:hypothetical protein